MKYFINGNILFSEQKKCYVERSKQIVCMFRRHNLFGISNYINDISTHHRIHAKLDEFRISKQPLNEFSNFEMTKYIYTFDY